MALEEPYTGGLRSETLSEHHTLHLRPWWKCLSYHSYRAIDFFCDVDILLVEVYCMFENVGNDRSSSVRGTFCTVQHPFELVTQHGGYLFSLPYQNIDFFFFCPLPLLNLTFITVPSVLSKCTETEHSHTVALEAGCFQTLLRRSFLEPDQYICDRSILLSLLQIFDIVTWGIIFEKSVCICQRWISELLRSLTSVLVWLIGSENVISVGL